MRKSKIINLEGHGEVTIKEIAPFSAYKAINAANPVDEVLQLLFDCVSLDRAKIETLYASELELLIDGFLEVNNSFLAIADKLGLKSLCLDLADKFKKSLPELFADSLQGVMGKLPGITAGQSS